MAKGVDYTPWFGAIWCSLDSESYKTSAEIAEAVEASRGTVISAISAMRDSGLPVISDLHYGYKKPASDEEIWLCIRQIEERISGLQDTVRTLERMVKR